MTRPKTYSDKRNSGIPSLGALPWGTHFCQFYHTQKDFLEVLLPYFRAGLLNNECCVLIASETMDPGEATKALNKGLRLFEEYLATGQLQIIPHSSRTAVSARSGKAIVPLLDRAISAGFDGLRLACHAFPLRKGNDCSDVVARYNVIGFFAYPRDSYDATGLMEVINRHRYALVRNSGKWEVIESSEARVVKDALSRSEQKLQSLFNNMSEGFAYHRIVLDSRGKPSDYVFLEVNEAFEKLTGISASRIVGKTVKEVIPESESADWISRYGKVALTGKPVQFENYSASLNKWFSISAFSLQKGFFAVTFSDITGRKRSEAAIQRNSEILQCINHVLGTALKCRTREELAAACLDVAVKLTGSRCGFIGEMSKDGVHDLAVSNPGWDMCRKTDSSGHGARRASLKLRGVYGRVLLDGKGLFTNDPRSHPDSIGLPEWHPPVESFLGAPLMREGRILGMIAVANRPGGYSSEDLEALEALAPAVVEAFMRKRAEEQLRKAHDELDRKVRERTDELRRVNRTLRMISECNQILVRAKNERELIRDICRIVVEMGGYRMAWVGYAENNGDAVLPVASMGCGQDDLGMICPMEGAERFSSHTSTCIRKGELQIVRDYSTKKETEALKRGLLSSIALPLISNGSVFGALTIYSEKKNVFDRHQIALLRELADDLAFGIGALRVQIERDQARLTAEQRARQLQALAAELVQAEQKERRQLARILHDHLQQLLVGAKIGASLMRTKAVNEETRQMAELVIDTLDEAISSSRSLSADLYPPILHEKGLAAGLKWLGRHMQEKHGLSVDVEIEVRQGDEFIAEQISQFLFTAVRELLLNTVKYSQVHRARVRMRMLEGDVIEVTVSDDGVGFDPAKLGTGASTVGGFGLFSIRERLDYLRGHMDISSEPGKGSRFVLVVPARLSASAVEPERNRPEAVKPNKSEEGRTRQNTPVNRKKIKVVLADDHPVVRHGLARLIEEQADIIVVGQAGDGQAAIDMVRQLGPDVVLMDVNLPIISGFDATRRITSEFPGTSVIGLSMHEETDIAAAMSEAGAVAYLTKGGPIEDLISAIRACVTAPQIKALGAGRQA